MFHILTTLSSTKRTINPFKQCLCVAAAGNWGALAAPGQLLLPPPPSEPLSKGLPCLVSPSR